MKSTSHIFASLTRRQLLGIAYISFFATSPAVFAQLTGDGMRVNVSGTAGGNFLTTTDGRTWSITGANSAVNGSDTLLPQFIRPSSVNQEQWDTEQVVVGSPQGEQFILEGRIGNRTSTGDYEGGILPVTLNDPIPPAFEGNFQPGISTSPTLAQGNRTMTSGSAFNWSIEYNPATISTDAEITFTGHTGSPISHTFNNGAPEFNTLVLRVNTGGANVGETRILALTGLAIQRGSSTSPIEDLQRQIGVDISNDVVADYTATATTTGEREFGVWSDILDENTYFRLTGTATYTWGAKLPNGSQMAWQAKLLNNAQSIPEPSPALLLLAGLLGYFVLHRRSLRE